MTAAKDSFDPHPSPWANPIKITKIVEFTPENVQTILAQWLESNHDITVSASDIEPIIVERGSVVLVSAYRVTIVS